MSRFAIHRPHEDRGKRVKEKSPAFAGLSFSLISSVAGPGIAPGLEDYEPSVRLYTTPHVCFKEQKDYNTHCYLTYRIKYEIIYPE